MWGRLLSREKGRSTGTCGTGEPGRPAGPRKPGPERHVTCEAVPRSRLEKPATEPQSGGQRQGSGRE